MRPRMDQQRFGGWKEVRTEGEDLGCMLSETGSEHKGVRPGMDQQRFWGFKASAEQTESVMFRDTVWVQSLSLGSLTPALPCRISMSRTFYNLPHLPAGFSSLSFLCWKRKLPPPTNAWTFLFPVSLRYEVYSTPSPAEAPVHPSALLGMRSIAVDRGWVHRWEEVVGESWLEGLEEH